MTDIDTDVEQIRERLHTLLSTAILDGSDRDVPSGAPLGEAGIGLDSLALVQFLTAVEQEFTTEIPLQMWSDVSQLSLDDCAAAVDRLRS